MIFMFYLDTTEDQVISQEREISHSLVIHGMPKSLMSIWSVSTRRSIGSVPSGPGSVPGIPVSVHGEPNSETEIPGSISGVPASTLVWPRSMLGHCNSIHGVPVPYL